jgi:TDG/mug DNA glycosylase family protein
MMAKPLSDVIARDLAIIFVGLNPGVSSAMAGHHFVSRSNRFWKVLHLSGFTSNQLRPEDDWTLPSLGLGLTTVVARATRGVDDLDPKEFVEAATNLRRRLQYLRPKWVAFLGKAAYGAITGRRNIEWGRQPEMFGAANVWVLPNPSGRNLAFTLDELVKSYRLLRLFTEVDGS